MAVDGVSVAAHQRDGCPVSCGRAFKLTTRTAAGRQPRYRPEDADMEDEPKLTVEKPPKDGGDLSRTKSAGSTSGSENYGGTKSEAATDNEVDPKRS
jgi:hypothetical protein